MRNSKKLKEILVIIHGVGDLTMRKLFPALYKLFECYGDDIDLKVWCTSAMPAGFDPAPEVYEHQFRDRIFKRHPNKFSKMLWELFSPRNHFIPGRCTNDSDFSKFAAEYRAYRAAHPDAGVLVFLSLHPDHFLTTVENYRKHELIRKTEREPELGWTRMLVEKPFALTVDSGQKLYLGLKSILPEESAFAMDHYLFKPMVHGILPYRFGNTLTEPRHNKKFVKSVRIRALETVGVEGRGAYVGATRDMILSHLLLVYALTRIGQPDEVQTIENLHKRLIGSMTELRTPGVITGLQLGRYTAGSAQLFVDGQMKEVSSPGFLEEPGGDPLLDTGACLTIRPPGPRWGGETEFKIITGKRMAPFKRVDWRNEYRLPPHTLFNNGIFAVKNGPEAIKRNEINYVIEEEVAHQTNGHFELKRRCGTKRRMMVPDCDHSFGITVNDEESFKPLGDADGYYQMFEELLVPDRLVALKTLTRRTDQAIREEEIPEIVSTQSLCVLPVTFQLEALKALEGLWEETRHKKDGWVNYPSYTCPWD